MYPSGIRKRIPEAACQYIGAAPCAAAAEKGATSATLPSGTWLTIAVRKNSGSGGAAAGYGQLGSSRASATTISAPPPRRHHLPPPLSREGGQNFPPPLAGEGR